MTPLDIWARQVPCERRYVTKWLSPAQCCIELYSGQDCVGIGFGRSSEKAATDALSARGLLQAREIYRMERRVG